MNLNPSPMVSPKISHPDVIVEEPENVDGDVDDFGDEEEDYFKTNSNDKSQSKQKADNLLTQPIKTQTNTASINRENNLVAETTGATSISTSQQQYTKPAIEVASNSSVQNSKIPDRKNASPEIKGN